MYRVDDLVILKCSGAEHVPFYRDMVRIVVPPAEIAIGQTMIIEHRGTRYRVLLVADKSGNVRGWEVVP